MLLSRFWYLLLATVAVVAIAFGMLVRGAYENDRGRDAETLLSGDRRQIEEYLRTDARVRIDTLRELSTGSDFTRLMNQARERRDDTGLRDLSTRIGTQLRTLNERLEEPSRTHMLIALDARGYVVGRDGFGGSSGIGDYLGSHPLAAAALNGYLRDDMWGLQGSVYRMAAVPVIHQGRYVGALLGGRVVDEPFVTRISDALAGATVGFFSSGRVDASHDGQAERGRPAVRATTLGELLPRLADNSLSTEFSSRGFSNVIQVDNNQGVAVFAKIPGMVGLGGGGFVVARPRPVLPTDFLLHPPTDLAKKIKWTGLIVAGVFAFLFAMLWLFLEHDDPDRRLRGMLKLLAGQKIERLDPLKLRGGSRRLALAINEAFEAAMKAEFKRVGAAPRSSVEDIGKLLDGSAGDPAAAAMIAPPPGSGPPRPPAVSMNGGPPRPPPPPGSSGLVNAQELIAAAQANGLTVFANLGEEQAHWKEVFEQFIVERKKNGETTDDVTWDKFAGVLNNTKQGLTAKTQARSVRFTVQSKDGKAALKAIPLK